MSGIKRNPSDRQSTMLTSATRGSRATANRETHLPSTAPTALSTDPGPRPAQLLDLPALTDTLPELEHKLVALAEVVSRGESIAVATGRSLTVTAAEHHSIPGASRLSQAEVAELQTCRIAIDISREVEARIRREVRLLTKKIHKCSEVLRGRLVSLQAKNPRSKHYRKTEFRGGRSAADGDIPASSRAGGPVSIGSQLSSVGTEKELIPRVHGHSGEDRRQGIQLKGTLNAVSTLEKNSADGDDGRISPGPSSPGHYESYETSTSGHKFAKHYLGDGERCESTGVSGENEEQYRGSGSSPESQKRQRVR